MKYDQTTITGMQKSYIDGEADASSQAALRKKLKDDLKKLDKRKKEFKKKLEEIALKSDLQ